MTLSMPNDVFHLCNSPEVLKHLGTTLQGARRYRRDKHPLWSEWIEMPKEMSRSGWERYALEALRYADECSDQ